MTGIASTILTIVFILGSTLCLFYFLYLLYQEKGAGHAILGFLFPIYPYIWGWINAGRKQVADIMVFWTFMTIASIAFPMIMTAVSVPAVVSQSGSIQPAAISDEVVNKGAITAGGQGRGQIDDLFGVDEWTFQGAAGQSISIVAEPASGSNTDPRLTVLGPNGAEIAADDDGGDDVTALIENLTLPESGTYRIQVDVWRTGPYLLRVQ